MSVFWTEWVRSRAGATAVEFALALPLLLLVFVGLLELGRAFVAAEAVQKGLRAAGSYAARIERLDTAETTRIAQLVRTGSLRAGAAPLTSSWSQGGTIQVRALAKSLAGADVTVIRIDVALPYAPLVPGLLDMVGLDAFTLTFHHEQVVVGR